MKAKCLNPCWNSLVGACDSHSKTLNCTLHILSFKLILYLVTTGEFGGMMGLFMGLSLLTLVEILETVIMACYKTRMKIKSGQSFSRKGSKIQVTPASNL